MTAADQADLPPDDTQGTGCDQHCLCCKGGRAVTWRTSADWEPQPCAVCGGYPEREPVLTVLLHDRLADLKAACKAYKAQMRLGDPLRTLTLRRAQGILADMLDLEAGRGIREPLAQSEPLDAQDLNGREEAQRPQ